jgi:hypothetical protein
MTRWPNKQTERVQSSLLSWLANAGGHDGGHFSQPTDKNTCFALVTRAVIGLVMGKQPALAEGTAQHACHCPRAGGTTLGEDLLTVSQKCNEASDGAGYQEQGGVLRPQTGLDTKNKEVC